MTASVRILINCPQCDAPAQGPICEYCGTQVAPDLDYEQQKEALESFHRLVLAAQGDRRMSLLNHGFLPDDKRVLIESGLRCIPLLRASGEQKERDAAGERLRAIVTKLKLIPAGDPDVMRAIKEFEVKLEEFRRDGIRNGLIGLAIVVGGIGLVLGVIWFIARLFT